MFWDVSDLFSLMMGRAWNIVVFAVLHVSIGYAAFPDRPVGGCGAGAGLLWIGQSSDAWAAVRNPASLALFRNVWVGVHHENRFAIRELSLSSVSAIFPVSNGSFAADLSHFGFSGMHATRIGLLYGMRLARKFYTGVGLAFCSVGFSGGYNSVQFYPVEASLLYRFSENLDFGCYLFYPNRFSQHSEYLPYLMGVGLVYRPVSGLNLAFQYDDDSESRPVFRIGILYSPLNRLAFRVGYATGNTEGFTAGMGWRLKRIRIDLAFGYHMLLGVTPRLSVGFYPSKKGRG